MRYLLIPPMFLQALVLGFCFLLGTSLLYYGILGPGGLPEGGLVDWGLACLRSHPRLIFWSIFVYAFFINTVIALALKEVMLRQGIIEKSTSLIKAYTSYFSKGKTRRGLRKQTLNTMLKESPLAKGILIVYLGYLAASITLWACVLGYSPGEWGPSLQVWAKASFTAMHASLGLAGTLWVFKAYSKSADESYLKDHI